MESVLKGLALSGISSLIEIFHWAFPFSVLLFFLPVVSLFLFSLVSVCNSFIHISLSRLLFFLFVVVAVCHVVPMVSVSLLSVSLSSSSTVC